MCAEEKSVIFLNRLGNSTLKSGKGLHADCSELSYKATLLRCLVKSALHFRKNCVHGIRENSSSDSSLFRAPNAS